MTIGIIYWPLWFIIPPIDSRATVGLFLMFILFKIIVKCTPVLIIYLSVKFLTTPIIISERLVLPQYDYNEDARHTPYLDNI